jgi:hypothetical protein
VQQDSWYAAEECRLQLQADLCAKRHLLVCSCSPSISQTCYMDAEPSHCVVLTQLLRLYAALSCLLLLLLPLLLPCSPGTLPCCPGPQAAHGCTSPGQP